MRQVLQCATNVTNCDSTIPPPHHQPSQLSPSPSFLPPQCIEYNLPPSFPQQITALWNELVGIDAVKGQVLDCTGDFLPERRRRVVVNGHSFDWLEVTSGLPQGSFYGPLLFLVYIHDLPASVTFRLHKTIWDESDANRLQEDFCVSMNSYMQNPPHFKKEGTSVSSVPS